MSKKRVYVKPVTNASEMFGWLVVEHTLREAFTDDLRRYGLAVALWNVAYELTH